MAVLHRPQPPEHLADGVRWPEAFQPAPELLDWIRQTFLDEAGALFNRDHDHLGQAALGVLWTNVPNQRQMRQVAATAEIPRAQGSIWLKARHDYQLEQWFGAVPDFLITIDAVIADLTPDANFCARIEHELYHCAQAVDEYGSPRFRKDGTPVFGIRGHDVEEFVGVVKRYGAEASGVAALFEAASQSPLIRASRIDAACGTCGVLV